MKELTRVEPKNEVAIIFDKITNGLAAFEARKEELTNLKLEADGLKIESIEDRESINQVSTIRKKLKNARVEIEKEGKAMRDPLNQINKDISAKEKELVSIIEPTEKYLKAQEDWVESEKQKIKQETERKEQERIQGRIDRLAAYGYAIDITFLKGIDDIQFEKVVDNARIEYEKEIAAKAEAERIQKEEQERIKKEREELELLRAKQAEADRILKEREEQLEQQRKEIERKELEAERERIRLKEESENNLWRSRLAQLINVGWNSQEAFARYDESVIIATYEQLISLSDEEFNIIRDKHNSKDAEIRKQNRIEAEQRAKQEEEKRQIEIDRLRKEAAEKALAEAKEKKEEEERLEAERIAQASDKEKFSTIITQIEAINYPEMKSIKHKKLLSEVKELNTKVIAHIKSKM